MKRICLALFTTIIATNVFSQNIPDYESIRLEQKADYDSYADSAALVASNYYLSTPINTESTPKLRSLQYVIKWMTGTPNHSFVLGDQITKMAGKNDDLLGLYMCAATKYVLENKSVKADSREATLNTYRIVLDYCKNPANNVKIKGELKKMMDAYEKGELESYLK